MHGSWFAFSQFLNAYWIKTFLYKQSWKAIHIEISMSKDSNEIHFEIISSIIKLFSKTLLKVLIQEMSDNLYRYILYYRKLKLKFIYKNKYRITVFALSPFVSQKVLLLAYSRKPEIYTLICLVHSDWCGSSVRGLLPVQKRFDSSN